MAASPRQPAAKVWLTRTCSGSTTNIAVFEAKSKLSALLDMACSGQEVLITRHGEPIARLVPMNPVEVPDRARAVRALSKRLNIDAGVSIRKLVETGRD